MAATENKYSDQGKAMTSWGDRHKVITPHNTNPLPTAYKYIVVGATAGTVVCVDKDGEEATYYVPAGGMLQCRPHIIKATGTTATPLIGVIE